MDLGLLFSVQRWSMQMRSLVGELVRRWWRLRRSPPPGFSHGSTGVWEARGAGRVGLRGRCPPRGGRTPAETGFGRDGLYRETRVSYR